MRTWLGLIAVTTIAFCAPTPAEASSPNTFPDRLITLIVPFPAGGPSDALARIMAEAMSARLKQSIVVENVAGASGTIGLTRVVNAIPDGYTIGFGTIGTHVANVALFKSLPYDPLSSFAPIGLAGTAPIILATRASLPVTDLKGFVEYARTHRPSMNFGSAGVGSISHYACSILLAALQVNVTHVPYRGVAPAMNDLLGGHIDFMCDQTTTALANVQAAKIKAIAVLADQPLPQLPGVATAADAGYRDVNIRAWNAFFAPKGTPAPVIDRLNEALRAAAADTNIVQRLAAVGVDLPAPETLTPAAVTDLISRGIAQDVPALRARGERLD
jgi:tripartite-type tricarboxylate transporter receptor subunit TctC